MTLTGTVSDVLARERAARIATTVKGVRAVVNQIVVTPGVNRTDELQRDVTHALLADPAADSYEGGALGVDNDLLVEPAS